LHASSISATSRSRYSFARSRIDTQRIESGGRAVRPSTCGVSVRARQAGFILRDCPRQAGKRKERQRVTNTAKSQRGMVTRVQISAYRARARTSRRRIIRYSGELISINRNRARTVDQPIPVADNRPVSPVLRLLRERSTRWSEVKRAERDETRQARSISRHVNSPLKKRLKAASTYLSFLSLFSLSLSLSSFPLYIYIYIYICIIYIHVSLSCMHCFFALLFHLLVAAKTPPPPGFFLSPRAHGIIINDNSISGTRLGLG